MRTVASVALAVLLSVSSTTHVHADPGDSASGSGTSPQNGGSTFTFNATGGLTDADATGSMSYQEVFFPVSVTASVECMHVAGSRATIVGLITASTVPPPGAPSVGNFMIFYVDDLGTPGAGTDEWSAHFGGASITSCSQFVDLGQKITSGEIVVIDGPPGPVPGDDDDEDEDDDDDDDDDEDDDDDDDDEGDDDDDEED